METGKVVINIKPFKSTPGGDSEDKGQVCTNLTVEESLSLCRHPITSTLILCILIGSLGIIQIIAPGLMGECISSLIILVLVSVFGKKKKKKQIGNVTVS